MSQFVDTNIFIRLLMQDDLAKAQQCRSLFADAKQGKVELHTSEAILAEVVYVLRSPVTHGLDRAQAAALLRPLVSKTGSTSSTRIQSCQRLIDLNPKTSTSRIVLRLLTPFVRMAAISTATIGVLIRRRMSRAGSRNAFV